MKYYYIRNTNYKTVAPSIALYVEDGNPFLYNSTSFEEVQEPVQFLRHFLPGIGSYLFSYYEPAIFVACMLPKIKEVFERFNMPKHRWLSAQVQDKKTLPNKTPSKKDFFVLQILDSQMQELDFSQTRFRTKNMYATVCKRMGFDKDIELDFFSNYEEYQKTKRALINEHLSITFGNMEGASVLSSRYHYTKNYDILWGDRNIICKCLGCIL